MSCICFLPLLPSCWLDFWRNEVSHSSLHLLRGTAHGALDLLTAPTSSPDLIPPGSSVLPSMHTTRLKRVTLVLFMSLHFLTGASFKPITSLYTPNVAPPAPHRTVLTSSAIIIIKRHAPRLLPPPFAAGLAYSRKAQRGF
eukprot:EG_transcript_26755